MRSRNRRRPGFHPIEGDNAAEYHQTANPESPGGDFTQKKDSENINAEASIKSGPTTVDFPKGDGN